jgi:hypothetical protein
VCCVFVWMCTNLVPVGNSFGHVQLSALIGRAWTLYCDWLQYHIRMNIRPIRLMVSVADKPIDAVLL